MRPLNTTRLFVQRPIGHGLVYTPATWPLVLPTGYSVVLLFQTIWCLVTGVHTQELPGLDPSVYHASSGTGTVPSFTDEGISCGSSIVGAEVAL